MRSLRYYNKLCLLVILSGQQGQQVQTIHLLDTQHMIMQTVQTRKDILIKQSKSERQHVDDLELMVCPSDERLYVVVIHHTK